MENFTLNPWDEFRCAEVRDLCWVLFSPPLFTQSLDRFDSLSLVEDKSATLQWLRALDNDPTSIREVVQRSHFARLGLYFEALLEFWFTVGYQQKISDFCLHAKNLQIIEAGNTLGEFDFIIESTSSGKIYHLEVAVKFYLAERLSTSWSDWIGPNRKDRLDIKLARMMQHQLPLASSTAGSLALKKIDISNFQSSYFLCGRLFNNNTHPAITPISANESLLTGTWFYLSDFLKYLSSNKITWLVLRRTDWLTGYHLSTSEVMESSELHLQLEQQTSNLFLLPLHIVDTTHQHHIFVVDDHWSETKTPSRKI